MKTANSFMVHLKLAGADAKAVKLARVNVTRCSDDTGSDLIDPKKQGHGFNSLVQGTPPVPEVWVSLKSPARSATKMKELVGEVSLFVPGRDPTAVVSVTGFRNQIGHRIAAPALSAAGIDVMPLTSEQYQQICDAKAKDAEQKAKTQNLPAELVSKVAATSSKLTQGLLEPGGIPLRISDPNHKLIKAEFQTADGQKIDEYQSSFPVGEAQVVIYHFKNGLPDSAALVLSIATPGAMITVPFQFYDVALP